MKFLLTDLDFVLLLILVCAVLIGEFSKTSRKVVIWICFTCYSLLTIFYIHEENWFLATYHFFLAALLIFIMWQKKRNEQRGRELKEKYDRLEEEWNARHKNCNEL